MLKVFHFSFCITSKQAQTEFFSCVIAPFDIICSENAPAAALIIQTTPFAQNPMIPERITQCPPWRFADSYTLS
jgi:hypothetical protein